MYSVVAHGSGKSGFLPQPVVPPKLLLLPTRDPRWGRPPPLQLPSPGQCVQRSHHSGRGSRPKKRGFGALWGEGAGRGGTGGRAVKPGGLGLVPSADAEARKSR